jgi:uncharacterized membrane protein YqaE (UPF0057 family)
MDNKIVKIIVALFIPPLAVYLHEGKITNNFWINLVLTFLLAGIGGVLHALYIISFYPAGESRDRLVVVGRREGWLYCLK